jgi:hypothetical protein
MKNIETVDESRPRRELLAIFALCVFVYLFASRYDILEQIIKYTRQYENWELDEFLVVSVFLAVALAVFSFRRRREVRVSRDRLIRQNKELQTALNEIKQLRGIIPICSSCKKIRDDAGFWHQVESYIHDHSEAEFSHSICPDCMKKLYPDFVKNGLQQKDINNR